MYTRPFYVSCSDVDEYKRLKPSGIFKLFQDTVVPAVEETSYGDKWLCDHNLMWVITHVNCEIIRMPKYQEEVNLFTYPCPNMKIIYPRHFFIKDKDGNFLVKMSTTWALLDSTSRTFANLIDGPLNLNAEVHEDIQLPLPRRIKANIGEFKCQRDIYYSDCDLNRHLNNTRYIDFMFDLFNADFYKSHTLTNIKVDYLSEIKEKDQVKFYLTPNLNDNSTPYEKYHIVGKVEDKTCFISELTFKLNLTK